jgi:AAA family ATP:ADP antiporter
MSSTSAALHPPASSSSRWFASRWVDRALAPVTHVEPGEGTGAILLALNIFLLLAAYYLLKTVREAFILTEGGAEVKVYAAAGQATLLLLVVPIYSWIAGRLQRVRLMAAVTLFFVLNLFAFFALSAAGIGVGIAFYLWLGIFNVMIVAQFWAFANDLYTEEQGKRLFPVVGIGSSLGALVGAKLASWSFATLGADGILLLASALLGRSQSLSAAYRGDGGGCEHRQHRR